MNLLQISIASLLVAVSSVSSTVSPSSPPAPQSSCGPCLNSNYVAYNRCGYWSIDDANLPCCQAPCQSLFRLDSLTKSFSYRFTLSPELMGLQTIHSVWIHYRTPLTPARFLVVSVFDDSNYRPHNSLGSVVVTPQNVGSSGWHKITFGTPISGLMPGSVYHIVLNTQGTTSTYKYIELSVDRGRIPVHYHPTDAKGTSPFSPCDRWLAIMAADTAATLPDYFKVADQNVGYSPIFAVELDKGQLFGDPYDDLITKKVAGLAEYGQFIQLSSTTMVNYAAFWTCASGNEIDHCDWYGDCPDHCFGTCAPNPLLFSIVDATNPSNVYVTRVIPHGVQNLQMVYRSRPHWFGVYFDPVVLPAGPYYLVLSSPQSDPNNVGDGWVFSATNSTMPSGTSIPPTYQRQNSYAVESLDAGGSFHLMPSNAGPLTSNADTGFMFGYFPVQDPIGMACDQDNTVPCPDPNVFVSVAFPTDVVTVSVQGFNSGTALTGTNTQLYTRLLNLDCSPLTPVNWISTVPPANMHYNGGQLSFAMGPNDAFLWFECGHQHDSMSPLVTDEMFPIEVRVNSRCNSCMCKW